MEVDEDDNLGQIGCSEFSEDVLGVSGETLWLKPSNIEAETSSVDWKKTAGRRTKEVILQWNPSDDKELINTSSKTNNSSYVFKTGDFSLGIQSAKKSDSGHYHLEITDKNGAVCNKKFQVFIFDRVETPQLHHQWKTWANGLCQLSLYCTVPDDNNVTYALYRGDTLISEQRNGTHWENQTDASSLHTYTCNVSNKVSWANHTLSLTQGCQSVLLKFKLLALVVLTVILVTLFLGAIICFCMWAKKRRQSQSSLKENLTIYEYIMDPQVRRDQHRHSRVSGSSPFVQEDERGQRERDNCLYKDQMLEQKSPGNEGTIYSMIQYKPSDSTSQEKCSIYSTVQPCRKSGSEKKNQSTSSSYSVYEEVGKLSLKAHNPARLSRRELENFDVYF
ncbi:natural killer cell receptor 2B4 [Acomys russatus]|uniref:natural killer cell receptor 2B4 n=1 Tax=Acomys russatus TaxID=60746 RepID=UPI0021E25B04|nr:natural killer cell receptor 2B4 [Acomys russatus]